MDNGARIRINRETGEIEISGSEQFVKDQLGLVQSVLNISTTETTAPAPAPAVAKVEEKAEVEAAAPAPAPAKEEKAEEPAVSAAKKSRGRPRKTTTAATPAPAAAVKKAPVAKKVVKKTPVAKKAPVAKAKPAKEPKIASSFSAYMKSFKRKMKKGDWILAAGYYFLTSTNSETFSTFNTSKLLKTQGVELANPSQYMKNNVSSGRVEIVGKRAYMVTEEGKNYLSLLMTKK